MRGIRMICFECGEEGEVHFHHVVPKSKGGRKLLPLCLTCHGLVHERKMTSSALTRAAIHRRRDMGLVYNHSVFGYDIKNGKLVDNPAELKAVNNVFKLKRHGFSLHQIAKKLNAIGVAGKRGGKFYASTVKAIYDNDLHKRRFNVGEQLNFFYNFGDLK